MRLSMGWPDGVVPTQIARCMEGRKRTSVRNEMSRVEVSKPTIQRSRRQGVSRNVGATTTEIAGDKYVVWVANAVLLLKQVETADAS
jgi:hypothetical protein